MPILQAHDSLRSTPCNGGYVSDVSKCCTETDSFTYPVVIWSKYIDSEELKCSVPSNGNVSRLYARFSASSPRLGDESRPWFRKAVLYRSQDKNDFLGRSKNTETLFGKLNCFLYVLEMLSKSEDTWKPLYFISNRSTMISTSLASSSIFKA